MTTAAVVNSAFGSDQEIPDYEVFDACETLVNGDYALTGTHNGKPYWYNGTNYLYYHATGFWLIHDVLGTAPGSAYYSVTDDSPWPAFNNWVDRTGCAGPPTLRYKWDPGPLPSSCPGEDPEMVLTVTGAAGTINWGGETWVLPGDSGVQKTVCPTTYTKTKSTITNTSFGDYIQTAQHRWYGPGGDLKMFRSFAYSKISYPVGAPTFTSCLGHVAVNILNLSPPGNSEVDGKLWNGNCNSFTSSLTSRSDLNLILGVGAPIPANYSLTGAFFGSHVVAGITYAWAKGNGWPA